LLAQSCEWPLSAPPSPPWTPHVRILSHPTLARAIPTHTHLLDYQVTSNSWTFLEANVAIIVTCLPILKGPVLRIFPCLDARKTSKNNNSYPTSISRDNFTAKNTISSHGRSRVDANDSDEEFILHNVEPVKVRMTTDIEVTYHDKKEMQGESKAGMSRSPTSVY
jgi:hypothetical protein